MSETAYFKVSPRYQPVLRQIGLDGEAVFTHPQIRVWRSIRERENCTLDATLADGSTMRLHIKRHWPSRGECPAEVEARGIQLLESAGIATVPLVGWGRLGDGRSFLISEDLAGYEPADRAIERGMAFDRLFGAVAELARRLHGAGLHHRDLYLCHVFVKELGGALDLRLIDAGRVRRLPRWFARRWIVKDLAQLWYSTLPLAVSEAQRVQLIEQYAGGENVRRLLGAIQRKVRSIARHDQRLRRRQPSRNVSISQ